MTEETTSRELTDKEWELIQANGAKRFISYIQELLGDLLDRV